MGFFKENRPVDYLVEVLNHLSFVGNLPLPNAFLVRIDFRDGKCCNHRIP
jgi:hypothetical protein